jgi:hypothetical protein
MTRVLILGCVLLSALLFGCNEDESNALRDADAALSRLRHAGFLVEIVTSDREVGEQIGELPTSARERTNWVVISPSEVAVRFAQGMNLPVSDASSSHAALWSRPFVIRGDLAGARRAAAYGLLADFMDMGLLSPGPLAPFLPPAPHSIESPSRDYTTGYVVLALMALAALSCTWLARRSELRRPPDRSDSGDED